MKKRLKLVSCASMLSIFAIIHNVNSDFPTTFGVRNSFGALKLIPRGTEVRAIDDGVNVQLFCNTSSVQSWSLCSWYWDDQSCFIINNTNSCTDKLSTDKNFCYFFTSPKDTDWACVLNDMSTPNFTSGKQTRTMRLIEIANVSLSVSSNLDLLPEESRDVICTTEADEAIDLTWFVDKNSNIPSKKNSSCSNGICTTQAIVTVSASNTFYHDKTFECRSRREDTFGKVVQDSANFTLHVIEPTPPSLSTLEIVLLTVGLCFLLFFLVLILLALWCRWGCFKKKEDNYSEVKRRFQDNRVQTSRGTNSAFGNQAITRPWPIQGQWSSDGSTSTQVTVSARSFQQQDPRRLLQEDQLQKQIFSSTLDSESSGSSSISNEVIVKPELPPKPKYLSSYDSRIHQSGLPVKLKLNNDLAANDELVHYTAEDNKSTGMRDDLSSLITTSNADNYDFHDEFQSLGVPFRALAELYGDSGSNYSQSSKFNSSQANLPPESWI